MTSHRRMGGLGAGYILFTALFAAQAAILVLSPILPQMAEEFGVSSAAVAQLRSVSGVTAGIVALVLAVKGSRFRLSRLLYGGLGLLAIATAASAVAPGLGFLMVTHVVIGLGLAAVLSGGLAASETWARAGESRRVLSLALIGQPVAWIVGQPVVGWVAASNWRWAWVAVPCASAVLAIIAVAARNRSISDDGGDCEPLGLWRERGVKPWAVSELLAFAAWGGALVYAGTVFIDAYGLSVAATGLILGVGAAFYLPGNYLARKLLEKGNGVVLIGFALAGAACLAAYGSGRLHLTVAVVCFAAAAFFAGGRTLGGAAKGLHLSEGRRLTAMSIRTGAAQFGYLFGAGIGGFLFERWGFDGMAWGFGILFAVAGLVYLPRLLRGSGFLQTRYLRRAASGNVEL